MRVLILGSDGVVGRGAVNCFKYHGHTVFPFDIAYGTHNDLRVYDNLDTFLEIGHFLEILSQYSLLLHK
jgi:hypothetical protein